jgi:hypothetical protein
MAEIVMGIASPNSPMMCMDGSIWEARGAGDRRNTHLVDTEGNHCTYDDLVKKNGERFAALARTEHLQQQAAACVKALDREAAELAEARPDLVLLVSHDNNDLFSSHNQPVVCVYYGEKMVSQVAKQAPDAPEWQKAVARGQGQDTHHEYPVASDFARELIVKLMAQKCDTASAGELTNPDERAFGYTFSFPAQRLLGGGKYPVVPVLLNALFPPNQPTPRRCFEIGQAFRRAIEESAPGKRVAVLCSVGMSHFVVNEELDRKVLDGIRNNDTASLCSIPPKLLSGPNGQIRDLLVTAGIMEGRRVLWSEYIPVYRTPAGTGVGVGFVRWA